MNKLLHRKLAVTSAQCDTRPEMLESLDRHPIVCSKRVDGWVEFILVSRSLMKTSFDIFRLLMTFMS